MTADRPDQSKEVAEVLDYHALGFVDNPFEAETGAPQSQWWAKLVVHSAANRLWGEAERNAAAERSLPVWVAYPSDLSEYYVRAAENEFLARTGASSAFNALAVNTPMKRMRVGRVRGTLAEVAQMIAADRFKLTLGRYAAAVFAAPDTQLEAHEAIRGLDLEAVVGELNSEPAKTIGEWATIHRTGPQGASETEEEAVHSAVLRQAAQDPNPTESQESAEAAPAAPDAAVEDEMIEEEESHDGRLIEDRLIDYLVSYARARLSPVLARGFRAYFDYGVDALAQELRVTKAPRKTLAALVRLARYRWDTVVLMYDSFEMWELVDADQRSLIIATLSELRWALGDDGMIVILSADDETPEMAEQFAASRKVRWDMPGLRRMQENDRSIDLEFVQYLLDSASVSEAGASLRAEAPELAPLLSAAEDDIERFVSMAAAAFRDAVVRGVDSIDAAAIEAGVAHGREATG